MQKKKKPTGKARPAPALRISRLEYLGLLGDAVRSHGGDPEELLHRWLEQKTKSGELARSNLAALLEAERERRRAGGKAANIGKVGEKTRKHLRRSLHALPTWGRFLRGVEVGDLFDGDVIAELAEGGHVYVPEKGATSSANGSPSAIRQRMREAAIALGWREPSKSAGHRKMSRPKG